MEESHPTEPKHLNPFVIRFCLLLVITLLVIGVVISIFIQSSSLSTTERKITGEWIVDNAALGKFKYTFNDDRTFVMTEQSTGKVISKSRWKASRDRFQTIRHTGTITDLLNDVTLWRNAEEFKIEFHDPQTFELYLTHPKGYGDLFFTRVEEL